MSKWKKKYGKSVGGAAMVLMPLFAFGMYLAVQNDFPGVAGALLAAFGINMAVLLVV